MHPPVFSDKSRILKGIVTGHINSYNKLNRVKIISWDTSGYLKEDFDCFDDYLLSQMNDAIENL